MATITFKSGEFQRFVVNQRFHLGGLEMDVEQGEVLEFDGTTLRFPNGGASHSMPKLRGVIKAGWLIPEGQEITGIRPQPAGIRVRPADELKAREEGRGQDKFSMDMVADEERVVTSHIHTSSGAQIGSAAAPREGTEYVSEAHGQALIGAQSHLAKPVATIGAGSSAAVGAEGEAVGSTRMTVTSSSIGRLKHEQRQREEQAIVNRASAKAAGNGRSVIDEIAQEDPELAARLAERRAQADASAAKVGGAPQHSYPTHPDDLSETPDHDDEEDFVGAALDVEASEPESTKRRARRKKTDEEKAAEKAELEAFEWDKTIHHTKRVKKALEYRDKPKILRKILAMETPSVAEKINAALDELDD